jgi:hypothetical protein
MDKKYSLIEKNQQGQERLMARTMTKWTAFELAQKLSVVHPDRHYKIVKEVR